MAQTYSLTRALTELKLLDAKISRGINGLELAAIQIGSKKIAGHIEVDKFSDNAKSSLQSVLALIARRNEIKSKIVLSNAITTVVFPKSKKEMTVAEVIERKGSIVNDKALLNTLRQQYTNALNTLNREIQNASLTLEKRLEVSFGNKENQKGKEQAIEEITKNFNIDNEPKLIDPVGLKNLIESLTADIEEFESECDFLLSESNTRTTIEVSD